MSNKEYRTSDIFRNYVEDQKESIRIPAVIYIPNKLVTALCFPEAPVDGIPHITLLHGINIQAAASNSIISQVLDDPSKL